MRKSYNTERGNIMKDVAKTFRAIEVVEQFWSAYTKVYIAEHEAMGNTEEVEVVSSDYKYIEGLFYALKMTNLMQMPKKYKGESGYERLKKYLDDVPNQYPNLVADITTVQLEAKELFEQLQAVLYFEGKCSPQDLPYDDDLRHGLVLFLKNSAFIVNALKDEAVKAHVLSGVKKYL